MSMTSNTLEQIITFYKEHIPVEPPIKELSSLTDLDKEYMSLVAKRNPQLNLDSEDKWLNFKYWVILQILKDLQALAIEDRTPLLELVKAPLFQLDFLKNTISYFKKANLYNTENFPKIVKIFQKISKPTMADDAAGGFQRLLDEGILNQTTFDCIANCEPDDIWEIAVAMRSMHEFRPDMHLDYLEALTALNADHQAITFDATRVDGKPKYRDLEMALAAANARFATDAKSSWKKAYLIGGAIIGVSVLAGALVCIFVPPVGAAVVSFFIATGAGLLHLVGINALTTANLIVGVAATVVAPIITLGALSVAGKFAYDTLRAEEPKAATTRADLDPL